MRRTLRWFFVFLLLCGQQAALTHALTHASRGAPTAHGERVVTSPVQHEHGSGIAALCAFDAAFNQVLGAATSAAGHGDSSAALHEHRAAAAAPVAIQRFLAPLSRGPPVLL